MSVNIGHGDRRVIDAITEQATKLQYVQPAFATEIRGPARREAGRDPARRPRQGLLHARRRRGDRERDQARPPLHRPPQDPRPLPRLPRRHARGDDADRRSAPLGQRAGARRRRPLPGHAPLGREGAAAGRRGLQGLEDVIRYEGPHTIAAVFLETIVGTNGILIPPDGYIQGVREICDRNGILMVADEVMAGFGRTGRWFAVDHWDVVPDLMTMAKGLTSSYLPLGAVAMRHEIAEEFEDQMLLRRPDLLVSHPVSAAPPRSRRSGSTRRTASSRTPRRLGPVMRATTSGSRPSTRRSARPATSACSGSSTSSGQPRPVDAADAVQRHVRRDEGDRQVPPRATACTR